MKERMAASRRARTRRKNAALARALARLYWRSTPQPLYCLLFLLPLIAAYEFGSLMLRPHVWPERQLVAQNLLHNMLGWFGLTGLLLPGVLLLVTLLVWHGLSRHDWHVRAWALPLMAGESLLLTIPLFLLNGALLAGRRAAGEDWAPRNVQIITALGAGIYEEMVFRLLLIAGLLLIFHEALKLSRPAARGLAVGLASLAFAACHFAPIGANEFAWPNFLVLVLDGAFLSLVYLWRGLGVAVGCHAGYNVILALT